MSNFLKIFCFLILFFCPVLSVNAAGRGPQPEGQMGQPPGAFQGGANQPNFSMPRNREIDYERIYEGMAEVNYKFQHNIDPYQQEDYKDYMWSPYPLMRISEPLYFKNITIPVGYYLLTPRNVEGRDVVTFKTNGKVAFIIPAYEKTALPIDFYTSREKAMPKPRIAWYKRPFHAFSRWFKKKTAKNAMQMDPPKSRIETENLDSDFYEIDLYYDLNIYKMIFKTTNN